MEHFIEHIEIRNFKSIRQLNIAGLKRINLFIGRPNVGKSNILEALSLFSLPYIWEGSKKLTDLVRLENSLEIFHDGEYEQFSFVKLSLNRSENWFSTMCYEITFNKEFGGLIFTEEETQKINQENKKIVLGEKFWTDKGLKIARKENLHFSDFVKAYSFKINTLHPKILQSQANFLYPPFGQNLLYILELMPELRKIYAQWFGQYGLQLVLDRASNSVKIQKQKGDYEVFQLPYSSIADTLQRIIFYKTAVASNQNSVLLFEEPEAHAYPPYIAEFTQEVIRSLTNQFFIVTHSPLIVEEFLTDAIDDLGIFMVDFKDGQTAVRVLTTEEIYEVRHYGIDLFFNNESYPV